VSNESIAAHVKRWFGHPTIPPVVSAHMPAHDGDLAELDELQERIFDELDSRFLDGRRFGLDYDGCASEALYFEGRRGLHLAMYYWPDDRAAEQLSVWRAQIDGVA
jgi:hypothetical protein